MQKDNRIYLYNLLTYNYKAVGFISPAGTVGTYRNYRDYHKQSVADNWGRGDKYILCGEGSTQARVSQGSLAPQASESQGRLSCFACA